MDTAKISVEDGTPTVPDLAPAQDAIDAAAAEMDDGIFDAVLDDVDTADEDDSIFDTVLDDVDAAGLDTAADVSAVRNAEHMLISRAATPRRGTRSRHTLFVPDPVTDGTAVLNHDGFDHHAWQSAVRAYPKLQATLATLSTHVSTGPALLRDIFWSFLKRAVVAEPLVPLTLSHAINHRFVEEILSTAEWHTVRSAGTVGDPLLAAIAALGVVGPALAKLDTATLAHINRVAELEQGATALWAKAAVLDDLAQQAAGTRARDLYSQAAQARAEAQVQQADAEKAADDLAATAEERADRVRRAARQALAQAAEDIATTHAALHAFTGGYDAGRTGAGQRAPMRLAEKLTLAQTVGQSRALQEIAALCGRLTRIALHVQRTRVTHPPDEIISLRLGHDLNHLVPSQWALLADADTEDVFYLNYAEGRLLQYVLQGNEKEGQGPIIVALDSSGSMRDMAGTMTKEGWSKAVMLAFLAIARKQKRDMAVIHFSSAGQLQTFRFPLGQGDHTTVMDCATFFYNGGTVFEEWMAAALDLVAESPFARADVICITDGLTTIDPLMRATWQRSRHARHMRAFGVLIGSHQGAGVLASITDALLTLDNLADDLPVLQTLFAV